MNWKTVGVIDDHAENIKDGLQLIGLAFIGLIASFLGSLTTNPALWSSVGQLVGAVAVVVRIVFIALERQDRRERIKMDKAARAEARRRADAENDRQSRIVRHQDELRGIDLTKAASMDKIADIRKKLAREKP